MENARKVDILRMGCAAAKEYHEAIRQVTGTFLDVDHRILVANSEGLYAQDRQIRTRLMVSAVAEINGETQTGGCRPGRRMGLEMFESIDPKAVGIHAARQAVTMAGAGYCPAGVMPVAIDNGFGGVIFHEACGHSLEASAVAYDCSQFAGKLGQKIANEKVTAIDDGTIPNAWGSINIDDEGTPARRKNVVENGVLTTLLYDRRTAAVAGKETTGNASKGSYAAPVTIRPFTFYVAAGDCTEEELLSSEAGKWGGADRGRTKTLHTADGGVYGRDYTLAVDLPAMGSKLYRLCPEAPHPDAAKASAAKAAAAQRKAAKAAGAAKK